MVCRLLLDQLLAQHLLVIVYNLLVHDVVLGLGLLRLDVVRLLLLLAASVLVLAGLNGLLALMGSLELVYLARNLVLEAWVVLLVV